MSAADFVRDVDFHLTFRRNSPSLAPSMQEALRILGNGTLTTTTTTTIDMSQLSPGEVAELNA
jgi:hypothetical protein